MTPQAGPFARGAAAAALLLCLASPLLAAGARRPNVLFLFTDDQRIDTIHALGNRHILTPNMDKLANAGTVFRNAYCLGSNFGAVCLPSRNMLMSGRAYFRWEGPYASADKPNWPDAMKELGYITYHYGKRGNTAIKIQERFDINQYLDDMEERRDGEPGKTIVDDAIRFVKEDHAGKPFFLYLAFGNPHDPRVAAKKYMDRYQESEIPLPPDYLPIHPFDDGEMVIRDELLAPWPRTPAIVRKELHDYYAVITALDGHIGRLLAALKETGQYDDTIILFSSDHGLSIGSHGLMGKQSLYEDSIKSPLLISGPGIPKGKTDALVYLLDLFPTVVDLAGGEVPPGLDGKSLKPVIQGKARGVRDTLFLSYREVQRAVRDERWKLIRYPQINRTQLFDLEKDPYEIHDLAAGPGQDQRIARLMNTLAQWQQRLGDTLPLTSPNPAAAAWNPPGAEELKQLKSRWKMN